MCMLLKFLIQAFATNATKTNPLKSTYQRKHALTVCFFCDFFISLNPVFKQKMYQPAYKSVVL